MNISVSSVGLIKLISGGDSEKRFTSLRYKHFGLTNNIFGPYVITVIKKKCSRINIFQRFQVDGEEKYLPEVQELIRPERNTLTVSYQDVESYNSQLSTILQEEYYR